MNNTRLLKTDMELFAAALHQRKVRVYFVKGVESPELLESGGIIEKYSDFDVKINGSHYTRFSCEFRA